KETAVKVKGEEVTYSTDSTTMKGYIAYDENQEGKRPAILIVHEWWGHNEYVRERAEKLAALGYTALAVDMYGDGKLAEHPADAMKFTQTVMSNLTEATARFDAAIALLKANPTVDGDKIAAIGYCFGGSVAMTMANAGADLDAVAAFHSGVQLPIMPGENLKAKVLVCNGADDEFIKPEQVETFKAMMDSAKADYKYITYEGAVHGFTSKGADSLGQKFKLPLAYNQEADEKSWKELQDLLSSVF
ncbi:MAG: dienelactone hydrolase family protein, partial [Bacteroidota bacterium]